MIARVIVDVPSRQTDRPFDYAVPAELESWIEVGSRVGVPFGGRTLQGFVVELTQQSEVSGSRLKPLAELLDPVPPLSPDLVELAHWISVKYCCTWTAALQAMIPAALKGKAERYIGLGEGWTQAIVGQQAERAGRGEAARSDAAEPGDSLLPQELRDYIARQGLVRLESLQARFPQWELLMAAALRSGELTERVAVKDRLAVKKVLTVFPLLTEDELREELGKLSSRAARQRELLETVARCPGGIALQQLLTEAGGSASSVRSLAAKGLVELREVEQDRDPYAGREFGVSEPLQLTEGQASVYRTITGSVLAREAKVYLLQGVTGSGKTEVYLQSIALCIAQGRQAIVLVPEISLTPQMVERFKSRFGDAVAVLHSRLSNGERYDEWRKIKQRRVQVAIGARSAIFAPFDSVGLIIIDEEHESSYKQEETPKYHARDVAIKRARQHDAVVVLGSATPSLESYMAARRAVPPAKRPADARLLDHATATGAVAVSGHPRHVAAGGLPAPGAQARAIQEEARPGIGYGEDIDGRQAAAAGQGAMTPPAGESQEPTASVGALLPLPERALGRPLPPVEIVDMREELKAGNRSMFSRPLHSALQQCLERGEQAVLLLNRRGYSTFVMCRSCGYTAGCPHCDITLTYHQNTRMLRCHYCGFAQRSPESCPDCSSEHIRFFGTGTQRVEEELAKLFPGIRVIRMDVDTTTEKGSHEKWLTAFGRQQADVLLGTQMVAKGLDFPMVTLVGVIAADSGLHMPDFRAAEKTFQLLTQVAGRAGRHHLPGRVVIQSYMPEHYAIQTAKRHDYDAFLEYELKARRLLSYPPFCRLVLVTMSHEQLPLLIAQGELFAEQLRQLAASAGVLGDLSGSQERVLSLLGPVASPIPRLKDRYRFQCMVKYRGSVDAVGLIRQALASLQEGQQSKVLFSVDVDPQVIM
ncbi:replication restart helicase PriA [Paenibacillus sp. SYP-B4298]|uniref:replication restart helicase PriA n=1 Tax=Paenibacillus sp. SYP-B4298 TaxID=2996034 RepID=UPI0022DDBE79|nr:primosomal protein N' [Paenibacillus sp. SYP-B4298]